MQSLRIATPLAKCAAPEAQLPAGAFAHRQQQRRAASQRRRSLSVVAAKKGGGGGGKKGPGSLMNPAKPAEPYLQTSNLLMVESHVRKVGRPIFGGREVEIQDVAKELWNAPFALLAHDLTADPAEPRFVYGNKAALDLFECTWDQLSAEDVQQIQEERSSLLEAAKQQGYTTGYSGWRVSFKGRRFQIHNATLFCIEAPTGEVVGQAAILPEWEYEDGTRGGVGAAEGVAVGAGQEGGAAAAGGPPPSAEELAAAEAAVAAQAAVVRELKEGKGLSNSSPEVEAAVAVLLESKEALARLQRRAAAAAAAPAEA
eukprot:scaffold12.g8198.t1